VWGGAGEGEGSVVATDTASVDADCDNGVGLRSALQRAEDRNLPNCFALRRAHRLVAPAGSL